MCQSVTSTYLKKDGLWDLENKIKALKLVWGKKGVARQLIPYVLAYTKPNFHPWDTDERSMLMASFGDILDSMGYSSQVQ